MEFEKRAIRSLSNMLRSIEKPDYIRKKITIHPEWILNPSTYIEFMRGLPGAEYFVSHGLATRRLDLLKPFEPGNMRFHDQRLGIILHDSIAVNYWLDTFRESES